MRAWLGPGMRAPIGFWDLAVRIAPGRRASHVGLVRALRRSYQLDRAQMAVSKAMQLFPGNAEVLAEAEHLARAWDEVEPLAPVAVTSVFNDQNRRLLLGFESVGATCEFGLVQRRYGAEPLGLFRWNTVGLRQLVRGLTDGLEGLGEPGNTELYQARGGEYLLRDRRWGFDMHTWMYPGQIEPAELERQMCRRLVFLRAKFLEDLRLAEKIFVYRSVDIEIARLEELRDALRLHGPAHLLAVLPSDGSGRKARDLVELSEGFALGYLRPGGDARKWDVPYDDWVDVCAKAATLFRRP